MKKAAGLDSSIRGVLRKRFKTQALFKKEL